MAQLTETAVSSSHYAHALIAKILKKFMCILEQFGQLTTKFCMHWPLSMRDMIF